MEQKQKSKKSAIIIVVLVLITTNFITFYVTKYLPVFTGTSIIINADDETLATNINKLIYLSGQLQKYSYYNEEFTEEDLWDGALEGMTQATGDTYAYYFNEEETKAYHEETDGYYVGIGVMVGNNDDGNIQVSKVFAGSPAEEAGIQAGDVILSADGTSLEGVAVEYGVTLIKGEEDTTVKIEVQRNEEIFTYNIVRAQIQYLYLDYEMLADQIGYIHIYQFVDNTYEEFTDALADLQSQGMQGLILDLRQNPGGLVSDALDIADEFLPECDMIYTLDTDGNKNVEISDAHDVDLPLVVLIDEYSASASEILSVALQVNDAAVFVGETSYGKGIIQSVMSIESDGTLYKFTMYEYFGADGTTVHEVGIVPDYIAAKGKDYETSLVEVIPHSKDAQLQKAIEVMKTIYFNTDE